MSDISSEKERLLRDATYLERTAKGVSKDSTYYLGGSKGDYPSYSSEGYISAQKVYDTRLVLSRSVADSQRATEKTADILANIDSRNANTEDFLGLEGYGEERRKEVSARLKEASNHIDENIGRHIGAALDIIGSLENDIKELVGFMEISEEAFIQRAQNLRRQAGEL